MTIGHNFALNNEDAVNRASRIPHALHALVLKWIHIVLDTLHCFVKAGYDLLSTYNPNNII